MKKLLPLLSAALVFSAVPHSNADDRRGDFWLDARIHFHTAADPFQELAILPLVERELDEEGKPVPPAPQTVAADAAKKTTGDSSVLVRLADADSAYVVLLPGFQKEWKLGPEWRLQFDIALEGAASAPALWLVDADRRVAKGRLPRTPDNGAWEKIVLPLGKLEEVPEDFAFDRITRAVLVFDDLVPAKAWLDAVRFVDGAGKEEVALTDQWTSARMAAEHATRAARLAEMYSRSRPAPASVKSKGKPASRRNDLFDIFASLYLNENVGEANRRLLEILTSDDPELRAQYGLEYTWALSATPALYRFYFNFGSKSKRFPGRLTPEVEKEILKLLWERNLYKNDIALARQSTWNLAGSENHDANAKIGSLLTSQIFMHEPEYASRIYPDLGTGAGYGYWFHRTAETGRFKGAQGRAKDKDGKEYNAKDHYEAWVAFWNEYLRERARRGFFVEKASPGYMGYTLSFLQDLHDYCEDAELRKLTGMFLDLFWAEWAQDQLGGLRGGAKTRANDGVPNGESDRMYAIISFFFGGLGSPNSPMNGLWLTDYRPPEVVWNLSLDREALGTYAYVSRTPGEEPGKLPRPMGMERTLDCNADSRLLRYSWVTPDYILGSQMDHPLAIQSHLSPSARWHGMTFSDSFRLIFPRAITQRKADGKWISVGSKGSSYRALQQGPVLISQQTRGFTIVNPEWFPGGQGQESSSWGVYLSPGLERVEEDQGWVFVEEGNAYLAIRVLSGNFQASVDTGTDTSEYQGSESLEEPLASEAFTWSDDRTVMVFKDRHAPVLFEAGRRADFPTFADFKKHIFRNKLVLNKIAVPGHYTVTYESGGNTYYFNAANGELPYVNGKPVDYAPGKTFDSPFLSGNYRNGVVAITDGQSKLVLDFEKGERRTEP